MDIFLFIVAGLLLFVGLAGCIIPVLPGVPLAYLGILCLHFTEKVQFSSTFLILWFLLVILVQVLDYVVPALGTKKFGGSKMGVWGSTIGVLIGVFLGPLGIILGSFVGAVLGELLDGKKSVQAIRAGSGAFVGFLLGTTSKLIICAFLIHYYIKALFA